MMMSRIRAGSRTTDSLPAILLWPLTSESVSGSVTPAMRLSRKSAVILSMLLFLCRQVLHQALRHLDHRLTLRRLGARQWLTSGALPRPLVLDHRRQ